MSNDNNTFAFCAPFGVDVIKQIIPHRAPFLLIDYVTEMGDDYIRGYRCLAASEPVFQGHFPSHAVYPGVLQIETIAQLGACWILARHENIGKIAYLMSVESAKFRRPACPGERLEVYGQITNLKSRSGRFVGEIKSDGKLVSQATVLFAFLKEEKTEASELVCQTSGDK